MTDTNNFKRIKVNTDNTDEVIRVGAPSINMNNEEAKSAHPISNEQTNDEDEQAHETPQVSVAQSPSPKKQTGTQYAQTTLEDLESSKMSGMQKAIVAVALVAVVVFVIYFVVSLSF